MKYVRFAIICIFALVIAQNFGIQVASILGGLGIFGIAVALAGSAILQNVFGAATIIMERLFRLGDEIEIEGHHGYVEKIGFRTTTIRKFDKSVIVLPNSLFITSALQNLQESKPWRLRFIVNLSIETSAEMVEQFLAKSRKFISEHKEVEMQGSRVNVIGIEEGCISIEVYVYTSKYNPKDDTRNTGDWRYHALNLQEQVMLQMLRNAKELEISMSIPTLEVIPQGQSHVTRKIKEGGRVF